MLNLRTVNIYDTMVFLLIVDIYSVPQSSTPSLVLPTQLPSMKLGDKTMMVLEIDEYSCSGPFYSAPALEEPRWGLDANNSLLFHHNKK